jgi:DnaJ-class molecular chaperone
MPRFKGDGTGDLFVKVKVVLPSAIDDAAKAAAGKFLELVDQPDPRT